MNDAPGDEDERTKNVVSVGFNGRNKNILYVQQSVSVYVCRCHGSHSDFSEIPSFLFLASCIGNSFRFEGSSKGKSSSTTDNLFSYWLTFDYLWNYSQTWNQESHVSENGYINMREGKYTSMMMMMVMVKERRRWVAKYAQIQGLQLVMVLSSHFVSLSLTIHCIHTSQVLCLLPPLHNLSVFVWRKCLSVEMCV